MTDLHTHILPGMDDGARDVPTALAMLRQQRKQGVDRVALTPHFYRDEESPERFFARRARAWDKLSQAMAQSEEGFPDLVLGAEVCWVPGIHRWEAPERFCLGNSPYLLLELPDTPWRTSMFDQIYDLMDSSEVIPILAHVERYFRTQKAEHIRELFRMGVPLQVSAAPMLRLLERGSVLRRVGDNPNCFLISDCHDLTNRVPNLGPGMAQIEKRLGADRAADMRALSREIFRRAAQKEDHHASK